MDSSSEEDEYLTTEVQIVDGTTLVLKEENPRSKSIGAGFFDPSYTVAGTTGNAVWEGCWVMLEYVKTSLQDKMRNKKVTELGSGTGLLGLCMAGLGSHVLCTDLPTVTKGILIMNIIENTFEMENQEAWKGSRTLGTNGGSIVAMPLDWTVELSSQITENDPREAEIIMAVETVWLKELIVPFVTTFVSLLKGGEKTGYFVFLDRSKDTSEHFATTSELFSAFSAQNCVCSLLHAQEAPKTRGKKVNIYEVKYDSGAL